MFGSYTIIVFVLNFLIQSHQTMACYIRIFRVLHTVQSSVFKVRLLSICVSSNFCILSQWFVFVNHFFHFLQNFLSGSAGRFLEKFAAVFSGEVYHIKAADKSQHFFYIFLYFFFGAIFRPGGRGILKGKQTGGSSRYSGLPPVWPAIPIAAARLLSDTVPGPEPSGPDMRWGARRFRYTKSPAAFTFTRFVFPG